MQFTSKPGDKEVVFADSIVKVNREGQIKRLILIITNVAIYTLDNRWCNLKRRISLSDIERLHLSELNDNFLAIVVRNEYDYLLASTRKSEIVNVLVTAVNNMPRAPLEVSYKNR